ncbi:DUF6779 domain-containing protein [Nocardia sp. NBC_01377]|uniref:DUF6779 domain-containing protein n=1 Tax=Nocardia sp. NBC_01377 TaxID=2903595 RepID=UPI0038669B3F
MVSPSRSSTSRRRRDEAGKLFIGTLILLGLVASVFLVFSNSLQFVRIGLVAALWAAAIGALAATKFRKESAVDKAKARDLQTVYELQLEREITARREYELGVESRVREEVGADASEMAALRMELSILRQNLQRLFDGELLADRPALRADATRIQELERGAERPANNSSANADGWGPHLPHPPRSTITPVFEPHHPEPPLFASPFDEPVTAETAVVPAEHAGGIRPGSAGDSGADSDGYPSGEFDDGYRYADSDLAAADYRAADRFATTDGYGNSYRDGDAGISGSGYGDGNECGDSNEYGDAVDDGRREQSGNTGGYDFADGYDYSDDYDESAAANGGRTSDSSVWSDAFTEARGSDEANRRAEEQRVEEQRVENEHAEQRRAEEQRAEDKRAEERRAAQQRPEPTHAAPRPTTPAAPVRQVGTARRRRRVDEDSGSGSPSRRLSVAEIMANLQSEENGNGRG